MATTLFTQNIIACIWDFDKTLIPGYMQGPLFKRYQVDEARFWNETNKLVEYYAKRGGRVSAEISYLNHLLTYVLAGPMAGLNNKILRECGTNIEFYPGLPGFFDLAKAFVTERPEYQKHEITLEHYIVSTGLTEMVRGSAIAPHVEGIWGCEFIENPLQPGFLEQKEFELSAEAEIAQIGTMIDNTTKTRALFEINKGTNKNSALEVNARIPPDDRRILFQNMIYIADGPSDIPCFSVVKERGGKAYGVYNPGRPDEFKQNDSLRQTGRIDHYGKADYREGSETFDWLKLQIQGMADRIITEHEAAVAKRVSRPPRHLNATPEEEAARRAAASAPRQTTMFP
ncbi:MAG: haloacid dehalogenase-like hydrolase [Opitutaceae bacterium]|nr:haloacid dehalogenase-like hydrolase [Opitutaceae bacterium]